MTTNDWRLLAAPEFTYPAPTLLDWAVERWNAEVSQRPLQNVHRKTLDDTWRQVIIKFGGDTTILCGPTHDELLEALR